MQTPGYHRDHEVPKLALRVGRLSKTWVLRVKLRGQDTHLGLGSYPGVTLEMARKRRGPPWTKWPPAGILGAGTVPPSAS